MDISIVLRDENHAIVDTGGRDCSANVLIGPNGFSRDVAFHGSINGAKHTHTVAVFGVLSDQRKRFVVVNHYRTDNFTRTRVGGVLDRFALLHSVLRRIGVISENFIENLISFGSHNRLRFKSVTNSITPAPYNEGIPVDISVSR